MAIKIGDKDVDKLYIGNKEVSSLMLGTETLLSSGPQNLWIGELEDGFYWSGDRKIERSDYCANAEHIPLAANTTYRFSYTPSAEAIKNETHVILNAIGYANALVGSNSWGTADNPITFTMPNGCTLLNVAFRPMFGNPKSTDYTDLSIVKV